MSSKTGILLINLGTPNAPTISAVRQYLKEFLLDPDVITLPALLRYLLVYGFILPCRSKQSAHAYQKIWTKEGSPLFVYSRLLELALAKELNEDFSVSLGMRYGNPSIETAVDFLIKNNCRKIIIFPLFPQFSNATSGSALKKVFHILKNTSIQTKVISNFYNLNFYIDSYVEIIQSFLNKNEIDFILFSYHGLPEKDDAKSYRQQCVETTVCMAQKLKLSDHYFATTFQSRLGKMRWIQPYTDLYLPKLIHHHVKKLAVVCPSFVADCLETLEEINIRLRMQWMRLGGESFQLITCLNDHPAWINNLKTFITTLK